MAVLLGKWATPDQHATATGIMYRMSDNCVERGAGYELWRGLAWYPLTLLLYSAGIAALAADNYPLLAATVTKSVRSPGHRPVNGATEISVLAGEGMLNVLRAGGWKLLPNLTRHRAPDSDYLFKTLQPVLDKVLFLGRSYDQLFDWYEVLRTLVFCDRAEGTWPPIGPFGWKHS